MTDLSKDEKRFFADISAILDEGCSKACAAVNFAMIAAYWEMGKRIVEQKQQGKDRANSGEFLICNLSIFLGQHFDKGFSIAYYINISTQDITYIAPIIRIGNCIFGI
jgi:hypothetical protein